MEVVLGVSMTPVAVRMALVEGADGDGRTLDSDVVDVPTGESGRSWAADQVVAAILGTRDSVEEGAHQLTAIGVAWTDHADGAQLRQALQANGIDDVVMVSELHAASALAQAVGRRIGCERTALLFVEGPDATLAVVRTVDGAVVAVQSRSLDSGDVAVDLREMVAALERSAEPPQAVFLMGAGLDVPTLSDRLAEGTSLPVHAPDDADLALARGAALAAAGAPKFEAETVVVGAGPDGPPDRPGSATVREPGPSDATSADITAAGATQLAAAGYMAPLGYSAVIDDVSDVGWLNDVSGVVGFDDDPPADGLEPGEPDQAGEAEDKPFLLVGSTLATIFVVGVVALVISLAVSIRPVAEQRPGEMRVPTGSTAAEAGNLESAPTVETIQAPVPVVREAPRTAFAPAPVVQPRQPGPAAPVPSAAVLPAPPAALPPAPAPVSPAAPPAVVTVPAAPAPVIPPIVLAPVISIPSPIVQAPVRIPSLPATVAPSTDASPTSSTATPDSATTGPSTPAPATTPSSAPIATSAAPVVPSATSAPATATSTATTTTATATASAAQSETVSAPSASAELSAPTVSPVVVIPTPSNRGSGRDSGSGE